MQRRKFIAATVVSIPTIAFGKIFKSTESRTDKGFVVKANESRFKEKTFISGGTSPNDIKVSGKDTDGSLALFEHTGNAKGGPPLHVHHLQDEIFFIVEGEYRFKVGEDNHHLKKGDSIFLPRKVPHSFAQNSDKGRMLFMFQPSGKMEDFFRVLGSLKGQPSPEEAAKIFANHEMAIVGPPLEID